MYIHFLNTIQFHNNIIYNKGYINALLMHIIIIYNYDCT